MIVRGDDNETFLNYGYEKEKILNFSILRKEDALRILFQASYLTSISKS